MADSSAQSTDHHVKSKPIRPNSISDRRKRKYRIIVCGVTSLIGVGIILLVLNLQSRLVLDPVTNSLKLQRPPTYLFEPNHQVNGHKYIHDSALGWRNIPNWQSTTFGQKLTINSKGLRDREYPYKKPAEVRRILVLGDSYAWGYGVADNEVFTEVIEDDLQKNNSRWEVLNAGVSGWGTDQEYLFLINEGFKYSPDIVVLAFFIVNDPANNVSPSQYGLHKPMFLNTKLELANTPVPLPSSQGSNIWAEASPIELTIAIMKEMERACSQHACQLVVMKFGRFLLPEDTKIAKEDQLIKTAVKKQLRVPYLDLDEQYREREITPDELLHGNNDGHWNAFGHRVTAEILHQFLIDSELVLPETNEILPP